MNKYQVLSRRYRPLVFSEVIGQSAIVKILKNALMTGKIPHAFLFTGIRGTGKTTTARIFARALNCKEGIVIDPCNVCDNCVQQLEGRTLDILEIDGASNTSVNDVRMLKENTRFLPSQLRYKVYIIDEVHMLSTEAFNALLKTLEEPPPYVIFILATTEPQKIPETVLSRCIRLNFKRVEPSEIYQYLVKVLNQEGIIFEDSALHIVARQADGSVRDALSILELILAYGNEKVTEDEVVTLLGLLSKDKILLFITYLFEKNLQSLLSLINNVKNEGVNFFTFTENILFYLRHLALMSFGISLSDKELSREEISQLTEIAKKADSNEIPIYYQAFKKLLETIRYTNNPQFDFELELIKICLLSKFLEEDFQVSSKKKQYNKSKDLSYLDRTSSSDKKDKSFIDFLATRKPLIAQAISKSELYIDEGQVRVIFGKENMFFYELLSKPEEREEIKKIINDYYGKEMDFKADISSKGDDELKNSSPKDEMISEPWVNLIMESFPGSKILKVREIKKIENAIEPDTKNYEDEDFENYTKGDDYE